VRTSALGAVTLIKPPAKPGVSDLQSREVDYEKGTYWSFSYSSFTLQPNSEIARKNSYRKSEKIGFFVLRSAVACVADKTGEG
jgi:hypothetical protein